MRREIFALYNLAPGRVYQQRCKHAVKCMKEKVAGEGKWGKCIALTLGGEEWRRVGDRKSVV